MVLNVLDKLMKIDLVVLFLFVFFWIRFVKKVIVNFVEWLG